MNLRSRIERLEDRQARSQGPPQLAVVVEDPAGRLSLDGQVINREALEGLTRTRRTIIVRGVLRDTMKRCGGAEFDVRVQARTQDLIREMPWPEEWRTWLMRRADTGQLFPVPAADPPGLWKELVQRCYDVGSRGVAAFYLLRQVELVRIHRAKKDQSSLPHACAGVNQ